MEENEGAIDQGQDEEQIHIPEAYTKALDEIEAFYKEKGGAGSIDFIAFGDVLREIRNEATRKHYRYRVDMPGHSPIDEDDWQRYKTLSSTCDMIKQSHRDMYPGIDRLFPIAQEKIDKVIASSPYPTRSSLSPEIKPSPYHDLYEVRNKIITTLPQSR